MKRMSAVLARGMCVLVTGAMLVCACSSANSSKEAGTAKLQSTPKPSSHSRPNIVFVLTDDLDFGEVSKMPQLNSLIADHGVSFENYFASVSLCCPSRTTTLRGQYSHNTGVETNGGTNGGFETAHALGVERSTVGTWLQGAGYRTALIGKYLNGYPNTVSPTYVPPGWDEWDSASTGGNPYSEYNYTLNENGRLVNYGNAPSDYGTDVYVKKAENFITKSAKADKPFFTYLALYAPHQPATPAPQDTGLFPGAKAPHTAAYNEADVSDKPQWVQDVPLMTPEVQRRTDMLYRKRIQSLQAVDRGIGSLVDTLRRTGQLDNTYIVFTSDNGFHLGQHRLPAGKQTAYDTDIHLPLVVRGPGVPAGTTASQIVGNIDLAPTFAALAHAKAPGFVDGRSFAPLLDNPAGVADWRTSYLVEHWRETDSGAPRGVATLEPADPDQSATTTAKPGPGRRRNSRAGRADRIPEFHGMRTGRYLYVEYVTGERELYDVAKDPQELRNRITSASPATIAQFHAQLGRLTSCRSTGCRAAENRAVPR